MLEVAKLCLGVHTQIEEGNCIRRALMKWRSEIKRKQGWVSPSCLVKQLLQHKVR